MPPHEPEKPNPRCGKCLASDKNRPVEPRIHVFKAGELGKILRTEYFDYLGSKDKEGVLEKIHESVKQKKQGRSKSGQGRHSTANRNSETIDRAFNRFGRRNIKEVFGFADEVLNRDEYVWQVLSTRSCSAVDYAFLIWTIAVLGPPRVQPPLPCNRNDKDYHDAHCARAFWAIKRFSSVIKPDVMTSYYRDRTLNRVHYLGGTGLCFEETLRGFVFRHDLPTSVLFDESSTTLYPPFPTTSHRPTTDGCFRDRENIDESRVIAVRLAWNQSSVVVFLNWRMKNASSAHQDELRETGTEPYIASDDRKLMDESLRAELQKVYGQGASTIRSLQLATRYFNGWLAVSGINVSEAKHIVPDITPYDIIQQVGQAVLSTNSAKRTECLEHAVADILKGSRARVTGVRFATVHWVQDDQLVFKKGDYDKAGSNSTPVFPIGNTNYEKAESICQLACIWRVAILITNFNKKLRDGRTWRTIHYKRSDLNQCESEIAVPIDIHGKIQGVVNVECERDDKHNGLDVVHVRQIELATHLFQSLVMGLADGVSQSAKDFITGSLLNRHAHFQFAQYLCKRFCEWVLTEMAADLAYIQIYDARTRVFRPIGMSLSQDNVRAFLTNEKEAENIGFAHSGTNPDWEGFGQLFEVGSNSRKGDRPILPLSKGLHAIVEHAASVRLLPARRGLTWTVYTDREKKGKYIPDVQQFSDSTREYSKTLLGLPFAHELRAKSDGVLWISWREPPAGHPILGSVCSDDRGFRDKAKALLSPVIQVVAAMYAIYRYYDPDSAAEPLPYKDSPI